MSGLLDNKALSNRIGGKYPPLVVLQYKTISLYPLVLILTEPTALNPPKFVAVPSKAKLLLSSLKKKGNNQMEKVKIDDMEYDIVSINQYGNLLEIKFLDAVTLTGIDLSSIEVYTSGGVKCTTLQGYSTAYKIDGYKITLSNDGSIYTISVNVVSANGYISEVKNIALVEVTEFTITKPVTEFFWIPKWDFELLQWVEGGAEPEPQEPTPQEPTELELLKQRLYDTGKIAADSNQSQQELLELLIEMEVI